MWDHTMHIGQGSKQFINWVAKQALYNALLQQKHSSSAKASIECQVPYLIQFSWVSWDTSVRTLNSIIHLTPTHPFVVFSWHSKVNWYVNVYLGLTNQTGPCQWPQQGSQPGVCIRGVLLCQDWPSVILSNTMQSTTIGKEVHTNYWASLNPQRGNF